MKVLKYVGILFLIMGIGYAIGPRVHYATPTLLDTDIDISIDDLDAYVAAQEAKISDIKPDNQARIIWANDSVHQKTAYSVVYIHGFSASQEEGDPVHTDFAKRYGFNLYLPRLEDHGRVDSNSFVNLTPENYLQSAEDAIDIAKKLGDKVIIMSCSTGGTLAAILVAAGEDIHSMILYSPNIDIYDPKSALLVYPWGKQITKMVMGGDYSRLTYKEQQAKYWNEIYHTNALFAMKDMINHYMTEEEFAKIKIPVFLGYYYKDEEHQDKVVSVARMHDFFNQIGTPAAQKRMIAFPTTGHHVVSSYVVSDDIESVERETFKWADEVLGLQPVKKDSL